MSDRRSTENVAVPAGEARVVVRKRSFARHSAEAFLAPANGGAVGRIWSSYVAIGNEHGLGFRIFGDDGALAWHQEQPEFLWHQQLGGPVVRLSRGMDALSAASLRSSRFRPGHPEGYALAFANLYRDYARAFVARHAGDAIEPFLDLLPGVRDGLSTMRMIDAAAQAADSGRAAELADPHAVS